MMHTIEKQSRASELADIINKCGNWFECLRECKEFCIIAGLGEAFGFLTTEDELEELMWYASKILGVEI